VLNVDQDAGFSKTRKQIQEQIAEYDPDLKAGKWYYSVPNLGIIATRQENSLGPMLPFLRAGQAEGAPLKLRVVAN